MKTIAIKECGNVSISNIYTLDLSNENISDCTGCWSCWWKTPGICIYKDLNEFYHQYVTADKAMFFSKVTKGFVSGNLKTLFDRMIPLFLPYVTHDTGESMHVPRYDQYPDIEFYYDGKFKSDEEKDIFKDYIHRVFYQFHSNNISIKPIEEFASDGGNN